MAKKDRSVLVIGGGSWGTALAIHVARLGIECQLWARDPEHRQQMRSDGANNRYLPKVAFPSSLSIIDETNAAADKADIILIATPSHAFSSTLQMLLQHDHLHHHANILLATKGLCKDTGEFLSDAVFQVCGHLEPNVAVISGPSFAKELARGLPTAMTVASSNLAYAEELVALLNGGSLRLYSSQDLKGVQLGGAIKNVIAIAAGVSDGLGYGANARAALITRGLAEIMRLGKALGCESTTLMGLSGMGDLVLTCTDDQSRNRRLGLALGQGKTYDQAAEEIGQAIEGAKAATVVDQLSRRHQVELPIGNLVYRLLNNEISVDQAVKFLFAREPKKES